MINKSSAKKPAISFIWHIHQPTFIPDSEVIRQTNESYRPILQIHEDLSAPLTLNMTGALIERIVKLQPDLLKTVLRLKNKKLLSLTGSGYYHPLIPLLSPEYAEMQIIKDMEIKSETFGQKHLQGFWPTDLGWTPWMTPLLHDLGFSWVIVDSTSLIQSNALPQWSESKKKGQSILTPEIESISLSEEIHKIYSTEMQGKEIAVFVRDHELSWELTGFDNGVIFDQRRIGNYVNKISDRQNPDGLIVIAEDGERINSLTSRNYKLFLSELTRGDRVTLTKPDDMKIPREKLRSKYFPTSTFQYDLSAWFSTADDRAYVAYLERVERKISQLKSLLRTFGQNTNSQKYLKMAHQKLLMAQDSGCIFWKFHKRTRIPCWEFAMQSLSYAQQGINELKLK